VSLFRVFFVGNSIVLNGALKTGEDIELEDNDVIDVIREQSGSMEYLDSIRILVVELDNMSLCRSIISELNRGYESAFEIHPRLLSVNFVIL